MNSLISVIVAIVVRLAFESLYSFSDAEGILLYFVAFCGSMLILKDGDER